METQVKVLGQRISSQAKLLGIFNFLFVLAFVLLTPLHASADQFLQYWENETGNHPGLILDPRISNYSTSSNYNQGGQSNPLANQISVSRTYIDLHARYGLTENFFIFGRLSALSSTIQNDPQSTNNVFGFSDQLIGFATRIYSSENGTSISLQGQASIPAYNNGNQIQDGTPYLGDQTIDLTAGGFASIPLSPESRNTLIELGLGYTYRSLGFSADAPWSIFLKHAPLVNGFDYAIGFRGQFSLSTDKTNSSINSVDQDRGAGGSDLIYALNPAYVAAQGTLGYVWNGHHAYLTLADLFAGKNAPNGLQISVGMIFDFGRSRIVTEESNLKQADDSADPKPEKNYDLEANVISVNDQLYLAKVNRGSDDGVFKGQSFDIFNSEGTMIARAKVLSVKNNEAALNVVEYYLEKWIEKGFVARRIWNEKTAP